MQGKGQLRCVFVCACIACVDKIICVNSVVTAKLMWEVSSSKPVLKIREKREQSMPCLVFFIPIFYRIELNLNCYLL